jgi:hypothetical protein
MLWESMTMNKQDAIDVYEHALKAISELSRTLIAIEGKCSAEEYERVKRAIGLSIGMIQTDILDPINSVYPELDDLNSV